MAIKAKDKPVSLPHTRYEDDIYSWAFEQAALIRAGQLTEIDRLNIAEELTDVGNEQLDKLESAIAILIMHLLKWDLQPTRQSRSWQLTIREQRRRIERVLTKNPGLKSRSAQALIDGHADGRDRALAEMDLPDDAIPAGCPYTFDEIMTREISLDVTPTPPSGARKTSAKR